MEKQMIAVIFGGQSSEHEISCLSAVNVIEQIDREKYNLILIGITKEGHWVKTDGTDKIRSGEWRDSKTDAFLSPDATEKCLIIREENVYTKVRIDIVFPVLHGLFGEDGTIQGLCRLAGIPFVGDGVLASAVGMDKLSTKIIADSLGIKQAQFETVTRNQLIEDTDAVVKRVEKNLPYPVFVKPCNAGSSCGVSKAHNREELIRGLKDANQFDCRILVEETIVGREVECAVLGGGRIPVRATGVGEILAAADFYDYDAKYFSRESKTVTDPVLPGDASKQIPVIAKKIFAAIDGFGLARVDFFVTDSGEAVFSEINTMPGFTAISMYPKLWEAAGMNKGKLVQNLIDLAFERQT